MPTSKEQFQPELTEQEQEQMRQPTRLDSKKMLASLGRRSPKTAKSSSRSYQGRKTAPKKQQT